MNVKNISFLLLLMLLTLTGFAHKKKAKPRNRELITYTGGSYSFVNNNIRIVGNIYELSITTNVEGIKIDSVWFGNTPVPCDVYETKTMHRVFTPLPHGRYLVKANKDLYKYFYRSIDSSYAYEQFVPPIYFKGELVLMYLYKGKRYYKTINAVEQKPQKGMR